MKGELPCEAKPMNLPNDISETSHSRFLMKRKKTSSTGSTKPVSTMPSGAHRAVHEVAHVVVVGGGERQMQPRRAAALDDLRRAVGARGPHPARFIDRHGAPVSVYSTRGKAYTTAPVLYAEQRCR